MRLFWVMMGLFLAINTVLLHQARQAPPPTLIAFVSDRDGTPAIYRMTVDGRFVQPYYRYQDPICTLSGGPQQFVVLTVPARQSIFPYCNALFYETHLLVGKDFLSMRYIGTSERGSLDPQGIAYIQDTWLNDARNDELLFRQPNLRVLSHCPSPTDARIAFVGREGGHYDLFLWDGEHILTLTNFRSLSMRLLCPSWSNDGRWIAVVVNNSQLWIIDTQTQMRRMLRDDVRDVRGAMTWSNDGRWIAFAGRIVRSVLYVVRVADGGAWEVESRIPMRSGFTWVDNVLVYDALDDQIHAFRPPNGPKVTLTATGANVYPTPLLMSSRPLRTERLWGAVGSTIIIGGGLSLWRAHKKKKPHIAAGLPHV